MCCSLPLRGGIPHALTTSPPHPNHNTTGRINNRHSMHLLLTDLNIVCGVVVLFVLLLFVVVCSVDRCGGGTVPRPGWISHARPNNTTHCTIPHTTTPQNTLHTSISCIERATCFCPICTRLGRLGRVVLVLIDYGPALARLTLESAGRHTHILASQHGRNGGKHEETQAYKQHSDRSNT